MKQRCHLGMVWLTWTGLPALAILVWLRAGWFAALFVLAVGIVAQVLYLRWFPGMSRWMGYGSVADAPADPETMSDHLPRATLYTANVCPFCPIMKQRLAELRRHGRLEFQEIDVTFRPDIIRAKGLRSVPVLEADGRLLVGNATTAEIVAFLSADVKAADGERALPR
jgi:predicted DCC family thiol-disulfide oxidoreductase YuxK